MKVTNITSDVDRFDSYYENNLYLHTVYFLLVLHIIFEYIYIYEF